MNEAQPPCSYADGVQRRLCAVCFKDFFFNWIRPDLFFHFLPRVSLAQVVSSRAGRVIWVKPQSCPNTPPSPLPSWACVLQVQVWQAAIPAGPAPGRALGAQPWPPAGDPSQPPLSSLSQHQVPEQIRSEVQLAWNPASPAHQEHMQKNPPRKGQMPIQKHAQQSSFTASGKYSLSQALKQRFELLK